MRLHFAVLVAVATFVASANATLVSKDSTADALTRSVLGIQGGASTNRFLRVQDATEDEDEERAFGIKSIPGVDKVSSFLTNQKLSRLLKNDKDVDAVFVKLKLNSASKNVFENPKFLAWSRYVDDFNNKHPGENAKSMLPTLLKQYGNERLATMLDAARKVDDTYGVATRLQGEQMKLWRHLGLSTDQLFTTYKLDDGVANLLANPGVNIWIRYADEFNPSKQTTLFEKLRTTYSDTILSQLLIAGMKDPNTKTLATDLQNQQIRHWLGKLQPPENVFKLLALDKGAENLLASPQLRTWVRYAESYKKENEFTTKATLFEMLRTHYTDPTLVTMLRSASKANSKREGMYVEYVEDALLGKWAKAEKPVDYVLKTLRVTPAKEKELMAAYSKKVLEVRPN